MSKLLEKLLDYDIIIINKMLKQLILLLLLVESVGKMKKVLITGADGFIGRHLVNALLYLKNEGVDYIIQTTGLTPDFKPSPEHLVLVASSQNINVYKVIN